MLNQSTGRVTILFIIVLLFSLTSAGLIMGFTAETSKPIETSAKPSANAESDARVSTPAQTGFQTVYNLENKSFDFCGEPMPTTIPDVFERLERDVLVNVNDRVQMILYLKRAGRFFPYIEARLKEAGMPDDLKYLMVAESNMLDITSPAGAAGFWQIMPGVGREYGLMVTAQVDERYHLEKATTVAITYLKRSYDRFKSWTIAAASYNMGVYGIADELKFQAQGNYYDLYLNRETARYLYRIVAIKEILKNASYYGYSQVKPYAPEAVRVVRVEGPIENIAKWALENGVSYRHVKVLNPWIRSRALPAPKKGESWMIMLPLTPQFASVQANTYGYEADLQNTEEMKKGFYIVREGDTIESISNRCGLTPDEIRKINKMKPSTPIAVGQRLKLTP